MKIEEYKEMIGLMTGKQINDELEKLRQARWENECIDRWAEEDRKYAQELYAKTHIARGELEDRDMRDAQESAKREQQIDEGGNDNA